MAHDKTKNENSSSAESKELGSSENRGSDNVGDQGNSKEICRNFLNNRCNRGDGCRYLHVKKDGDADADDHPRAKFQRRSNKHSRSPRRSRSRSRSPVSRKDVCRDYERGLCDRGSNCRFFHPEEVMNRERKQRSLEICRSFLKNDCSRTDCRFVHVSQDDEDLFLRTGDVSNVLIDQAVRLCLDTHVCISGGKPICRRFIEGGCREPCKFQHIAVNDLQRPICMILIEELGKQFGTPRQSNMPPTGGLGAMGMGMPVDFGGNNFGGSGMIMNSPQDRGVMNNFGVSLPWATSPSMGRDSYDNFGGRDVGTSRNNVQNFAQDNRDSRAHLETIQTLQRDIRDMEAKMAQAQQGEEEARKLRSNMQIVQMEKETAKDALARSEELTNHFKNQVQILTDEMKTLDSGKMELGIMARRVLGDLPAIEAKLIPPWTGGAATPEMRQWQNAAHNVSSLVQKILGLDVKSFDNSSDNSKRSAEGGYHSSVNQMDDRLSTSKNQSSSHKQSYDSMGGRVDRSSHHKSNNDGSDASNYGNYNYGGTLLSRAGAPQQSRDGGAAQLSRDGGTIDAYNTNNKNSYGRYGNN